MRGWEGKAALHMLHIDVCPVIYCSYTTNPVLWRSAVKGEADERGSENYFEALTASLENSVQHPARSKSVRGSTACTRGLPCAAFRFGVF